MLNPKVTFNVGTIGNIEALNCCLTSIANQTILPYKVNIFLCGDIPSFNNFYLEQICSLLRYKGIEVALLITKDYGITRMYDRFIEETKTQFCWFGNDDVIYDNDCLQNFCLVINTGVETPFYTGTKPDINNRNGYRDYSKQVKDTVKHGDSPYSFYKKEALLGKFAYRKHPDLGNTIFDLDIYKKRMVMFTNNLDEFEPKVLGDDWIIGAKLGTGLIVPSAQAIHLDKPSLNTFNRHTTNKALVSRTLTLLGLEQTIIDEEFKA